MMRDRGFAEPAGVFVANRVGSPQTRVEPTTTAEFRREKP